VRKNLQGVHVILDAGHGGSDPGAGNERVWEDDYAFDIACRVRSLLSDRTLAVVHPLVKDVSSGFAPLSRIKRDADEILLTAPPYKLDAGYPTAVAVNLRWLTANDLRRRLLLEGVADDRIVFVSIHADSLHRAVRGAMAYYPSAALRPAEYAAPRGAPYDGYEEAQAVNSYRAARGAAVRSEGLSRRLGEALVQSVANAKLPVHGFSPVRGEVQRGRAWVPAVLRYNRCGAAVLLEACNLNNPDDQRNLRDPSFRQDLADALVSGLEAFFAGAPLAGAAAKPHRPR